MCPKNLWCSNNRKSLERQICNQNLAATQFLEAFLFFIQIVGICLICFGQHFKTFSRVNKLRVKAERHNKTYHINSHYTFQVLFAKRLGFCGCVFFLVCCFTHNI